MAKFAAYRTQLSMGTSTSTGALIPVAGIFSMSGPGGDTEEVDLTAHDSTGSFRETAASFRDPGSLDFDIRYDPGSTSHGSTAGLISAWQDGATRWWRITLPDTSSSNIDFFGWVRSFTMDSPYDGALDASVSIRLTGLPVFP